MRRRPALTALVLALLVAATFLPGCSGVSAGFKNTTRDTDFSLMSVSALDAGTAWASGRVGAILAYGRTAGGIGQWVPQESGVTVDLKGISAADSLHVWAVGQSGTILFNDGRSWARQDSGTNIELTGVFALDTSHVWACGWGQTLLFFDGKKWRGELPAGQPVLRSVSASGPDSVWAVGSNGLVFHYNGKTWSKQESGTGSELTGVCAVSPGEAWACGLDGVLLHFAKGVWNMYHTGDEMFRGVAAGEGTVWVVGYRTQRMSLEPGTVVYELKGRSFEKQAIDQDLFPCGVSVAGAVWIAGLGGVVRCET